MKTYFVFLQNTGKMLCSLITNLIEMKVKSGQRLYKIVSDRENEKVEWANVT
jgi:hypothetical protein